MAGAGAPSLRRLHTFQRRLHLLVHEVDGLERADHHPELDDPAFVVAADDVDAQAGIPFPAGPVEIIRNELAPELLRHLTLSSAVLTPHDFLQSRVLDELCPVQNLRSRALEMATKLAVQPGFQTVKQHVRGDLRERIGRFVASGHDPFLDAFG